MRVKVVEFMIFWFLVYPLAADAKRKHAEPTQLPPDITLGHPRVWGYQRVYPLLDGLFQDAASIQVSQLTLSPNAANASSLDAIQNAFQLGVSFSQTAGATNSVAQQMNSVLSSNAGLQNQLLAQQSQLVQSALTAQQQVGSAQALVDQLGTSATATAAQQAAAASTLKSATDNLTTINSELTLVKSQLTSVGSLQPMTAPNTSVQPTPPTLPSSLTSLTSPPGAAPPAFPSSKQMDNQMNLLWERLSRLVGTLAQPDSMTGYRIDLMEINIGITPVNRKNQLFGVGYKLGCGGTVTSSDIAPVVIDLFPSASAVNIVDTKYRENRVGLAAVLSWFSVGVNAAYNRDHLQMSQALGQSAYITGYGVGSQTFGWMFGRNLGDDTITPGDRTLFALVAVPPSCTAFSVQAQKAEWFKNGSDSRDYWHDTGSGLPNLPKAVYLAETGQEVVANDPKLASNAITSVTYAPAEYDPTGATKSLVSVAIETSQSIDPQQIISINGKILKRSRDNFGRAVPAGGSGGLLETSSVDPNSWLPTGSTSFTLSLDPSAFGRRFPDILIAAPSGTLSLHDQLRPGAAKIHISGSDFVCTNTCASDLPALGYPKTTVKQLLLSQWHKIAVGKEDSLLVTLASEQATNSTATVSSGGVPTLQVLSGGGQPTWGGDTVVLATFAPASATPMPCPLASSAGAACAPTSSASATAAPVSGGQGTYRLACSPEGSRLVCSAPKDQRLKGLFDRAFTLELTDLDHSGGGIKAWGSVEDCEARCLRPLVWRFGQPQWQSDPKAPGKLLANLHLELINVQEKQPVTLLGGPSNDITVDTETCPTLKDDVCSIDIHIAETKFPQVTDLMVLRFGDSASLSAPTATLQYLRSNAQPIVTTINDAQTVMSGKNLFFKQIRVGDTGQALPLTCASDGSECRVLSYPRTGDGYLYFLDDDDLPLQATQVIAGVVSTIYHTSPVTKAATATAAANAAAAAAAVANASAATKAAASDAAAAAAAANAAATSAPTAQPAVTPSPQAAAQNPPVIPGNIGKALELTQ